MSKRAETTPHRAKALSALVMVVACALVVLFPSSATAQIATTPRELEHVGVTEHLDGPLPLDAPFRDHTGSPVTLRKLLDGKRPVVLQFAYHTCPVVCGMITNNLAAGLKGVPWTVGNEFDVITISIDPNESLDRTAAKRTSILHEYGRAVPGAIDGAGSIGWHFLVGDATSIAAVAGAAGFEYQYDERQKQWGHPSVVMVVKPNGHMARYLYGLEFPSNDLRLGLLEASLGRHMSTVEQIILYCYHYDPQGGKYVLMAWRVMQIGAGAIAIVLGVFLGMLWTSEARKKKRAPFNDDAFAGERAAGQESECASDPHAVPSTVSVRGG